MKIKRSTLIACIFLVAGLLTWYFYQNSKKKVDISVVGTNCDNAVPEIYLLIANPGESEISGDIKLSLTNKETKQKSTIPHTLKRAVKAREFRQDTVFVSPELYDFDCRNYEIKAKLKK